MRRRDGAVSGPIGNNPIQGPMEEGWVMRGGGKED